MGSPTGFAILLGIIIGVGVLFMAFALFYKFVVLDPTERWNQAGPDPDEPHRDDTGLPRNPYPSNIVVPAPQGQGAYNDVEMGEVSAFNHHDHPDHVNRAKHGHQHNTPIASAVLPVVDAVLYESDAEARPTDVNATDSRAQAMRDWYDS